MAGNAPLRGRSVLITGAAKGIGYETASECVRRGARVVMLDVDDDVEQAAERLGEAASGGIADVTDREGLRDAVDRAAADLGGLDVVIANAGTAQPFETVAGGEDETFDKVMAINVTGVWNTVRAALPHVIERRGQVALVSSVYAFLNGALFSAYGMSKAAVEALGRTLRVELAPEGVEVTVAYYGFVDTAFVHGSFEDDDLGERFEEVFPGFLTRRISPQYAAECLVDGIENRSPRVIAPQPWPAVSALRGITGPALDKLLTMHPKMRRVIREARDREGPAGLSGDGGGATAGQPATAPQRG